MGNSKSKHIQDEYIRNNYTLITQQHDALLGHYDILVFSAFQEELFLRARIDPSAYRENIDIKAFVAKMLLGHPHVAVFYFVNHQHQNTFDIVFEFARGLVRPLKKEKHFWALAQQLTSALAFLEENTMHYPHLTTRYVLAPSKRHYKLVNPYCFAPFINDVTQVYMNLMYPVRERNAFCSGQIARNISELGCLLLASLDASFDELRGRQDVSYALQTLAALGPKYSPNLTEFLHAFFNPQAPITHTAVLREVLHTRLPSLKKTLYGSLFRQNTTETSRSRPELVRTKSSVESMATRLKIFGDEKQKGSLQDLSKLSVAVPQTDHSTTEQSSTRGSEGVPSMQLPSLTDFTAKQLRHADHLQWQTPADHPVYAAQSHVSSPFFPLQTTGSLQLSPAYPQPYDPSGAYLEELRQPNFVQENFFAAEPRIPQRQPDFPVGGSADSSRDQPLPPVSSQKPGLAPRPSLTPVMEFTSGSKQNANINSYLQAQNWKHGEEEVAQRGFFDLSGKPATQYSDLPQPIVIATQPDIARQAASPQVRSPPPERVAAENEPPNSAPSENSAASVSTESQNLAKSPDQQSAERSADSSPPQPQEPLLPPISQPAPQAPPQAPPQPKRLVRMVMRWINEANEHRQYLEYDDGSVVECSPNDPHPLLQNFPQAVKAVPSPQPQPLEKASHILSYDYKNWAQAQGSMIFMPSNSFSFLLYPTDYPPALLFQTRAPPPNPLFASYRPGGSPNDPRRLAPYHHVDDSDDGFCFELLKA